LTDQSLERSRLLITFLVGAAQNSENNETNIFS
jgi:hypothetical protein